MNISASKTATTAIGARDFFGPQNTRLIGFLLALITVLIYLPVGFYHFIYYDDPDYVTGNPMVLKGLTWAGFKWAFTSLQADNWHPLTWLSHQLVCQLFGLHAGAHHLVNVLLHAANTVVLFRLWLRLTGATRPSALVAALFAWHPLHVESVAWVSERKDVLSTFFGLLSLLAYAAYAAGRPAVENQGFARSRHWWLALGCFVLGLLAKPMLVTLPFVMLLLDYWPLRRLDQGRLLTESSRLVWEKWPFFLLAGLSCIPTSLAQNQRSVISLERFPLDLRMENAVTACMAYLGKTLWPSGLSILYPLRQNFSTGAVVMAVVCLAAITLAAWHWRERPRCILTGWLWFLGMLVPVIGLIQSGGQAMADRYMYLPSVGLFVAMVFGMAEAPGSLKLPGRAGNFLVILVLAACIAGTEYQLHFWRDTETLFKQALRVTEHNGEAHQVLSEIYEMQGRTAESQQQYQAAIDDYALIIVPVTGGGKRSLAAQMEETFGEAAEKSGRPDAAIVHYRAALQFDPNFVEAHNELGNLLDEAGQPGEALEQYQAAARLRPEAPLLHENLGTQLLELGRFEQAMREYQEAARLAPADPEPPYLIGKLWLRWGRSDEAVPAFQNSLRLGSGTNDWPELVQLAQVLASDENPQIRNGGQALLLAQKANDQTGGTQAVVLATLAMASAETGNFDEARKTIRAALELASGQGGKMISNLQAQLQSYEAGRPFRQSFTNSPAP